MIKPRKLLRGDTVAIVSLSLWFSRRIFILWRMKQGIERLGNRIWFACESHAQCTQRY